MAPVTANLYYVLQLGKSNSSPGRYQTVKNIVTTRRMIEATAKIKRLVASDKLNVVAKLVTSLLNKNLAAIMRPGTITLERKVATLDKAWFEVEATFDASGSITVRKNREQKMSRNIKMI